MSRDRKTKKTGLAAGTPVLVGAGDSGAEGISTGVFRPGDMMVPVSYTHLEVAPVAVLGFAFLDDGRRSAAGAALDFVAVSYTHLDVYKRQ